MPRRPGAVQCHRGGGLGAARGACDLPALQLSALPNAGLHLRTLRLREPLLSRGVPAKGSPTVCAPRRRTLPADPSVDPANTPNDSGATASGESQK